jgi:PAS domain S-box-containing protein
MQDAPPQRHSEDLLELAQQAGRLGLFEWNAKDGSMRLSPLCLSLLELKNFDGRYESWLKCIHREDQVRIAALFENAFAEKRGEVQAEFRVLADRQLHWLEMRSFVLYDEDKLPARAVGVMVDITERKHASVQLHAHAEALEDAVRERTARLLASETLIRTFFDHSSECHAVLVEAEGGGFRFEEINPATLRLYGMTREQVLGRKLEDVLGGERAADVTPALDDCLRSGAPERYERQHGHAIVEAVVTPVPRDGGAARRVVVSARDVTERRRLEETLRQSQKMEAIGQLTGGVAHDFNNLLTVVLGGLELIGRQVSTLPRSPEMERIVRNKDMALEGARRAAALTSRLLAFSRQQPLAPKTIDANKLVAGVCELLRRTLGEAVALETVQGAGLWRTEADPNQLETAILNLAVNARDAMPEGGKVTIETANCYLDEPYVSDLSEPVAAGQYVMIAVTDMGSGMDQPTLARAFDPFFTTKGIGKGTGLGLSQVYGFVRQSSGHVKIYSEPGQGTSVKIYLRRSAGEHDHVGENVPLPCAPRAIGSETVLVVEDDAALRAYSVEILQELGYAVIEAENGAAALEALERNRVDLLFTDVVIPGGINGRQLADEALRRRPMLKVLFTTGYTRNAIVHHGRLDAGVHLIGKPFTFDELGTKIRSLLDR